MENTTTTEEVTKPELTPEQQAIIDKDRAFWADIDLRKQAITERVKREVFPITILSKTEPGEYVVGFAYAPDLTSQLRMIDKSRASGVDISIEACSAVMETSLIMSETDPRISDKKDLDYWKGACATLSQFMGMAIPVIKKK